MPSLQCAIFTTSKAFTQFLRMIISGKKAIYIDFEIEVTAEVLKAMGHTEFQDYSTHEFQKFIADVESYEEIGEDWVEFEVDCVEGDDAEDY